MDFSPRPIPKLEEEPLRTRKRIHENGYNESLETIGTFCEKNGKESLMFWHKFKINDLFTTKQTYQLVEDEESLHPITLNSIKTSVALNERFSLEILYKPEQIHTREQKTFKMCLFFSITTSQPEVPRQMIGRKVVLVSRILLRLSEGFISKRKLTVTVGSELPEVIEIKSEFPFDLEEEVLNELDVDVADLEAPDEEDYLPNGLINLGVTCYMNSYLQTIFHLKKFRYYINKLDNELNENNFVFSLQNLFYLLENLNKASANPHQLIKSFGWNIQQIFTQQDVQEFSFMFLDAVEKKCEKLGFKEIITKEIFQGISESYISCKDIQFESKREEVFMDIQLAIRDANNLPDAIDNYLAIEELVGENAYDTEKFGKKDAIKGVRFKKLPKVLIFHLGRFEYDYRADENVKILKEFAFPETLDMGRYIGTRPLSQMKRKSSTLSDIENLTNSATLHTIVDEASNGRNGGLEGSGNGSGEKPDENYKLFGVFVHFGFNSYSGHYEVYLKIKDSWFEFNDDEINPVDWEEVRKRSFGGRQKTTIFDKGAFKLRERFKESNGHAYMLVYIREKDYKDIVDNSGEVVEYPGNVVQQGKEFIRKLEKENFERNNLKVYLTCKESYVGKRIGRGGFLSSFCLNDHLYSKRFKQYAFEKFYVKNEVETKDFIGSCLKHYPAPANHRAFVFIYSPLKTDFIHLEESKVYPNFSKQFVQYVYIHFAPVELAPETPQVKFYIIKEFIEETQEFQVQDICLVQPEDTMATVKAKLEELNQKKLAVFAEDLQNKRLEEVEGHKCEQNIHGMLKYKSFSSLCFLYSTPENSENLLNTYKSFKSNMEVRFQEAETNQVFYLTCQINAKFYLFFNFIRERMNITGDQNFEVEISHYSKERGWDNFTEGEHSEVLVADIKIDNFCFTIKPVKAESQEEENFMPRLQYNALQTEFKALNPLISDVFEPHSTPSRHQLLEALKTQAEVVKMIHADLLGVFTGELRCEIVDFQLFFYNHQSDKILPVKRENLFTNFQYFLVPVIELPRFGLSESNLVETLHPVELNFMTNARKSLHTPLLLNLRESTRFGELLKLVEMIISGSVIRNTENGEFFEPEYLKRNLKVYLWAYEKEYDLEKVQNTMLSELMETQAVITACISIDSFRNNIKINI